MRVDTFEGTFPDIPEEHLDIVRVEVPLVAPDDTQYKVLLLDGDDTFDVVIHYPDGQRECVWSLVKDTAAEERKQKHEDPGD